MVRGLDGFLILLGSLRCAHRYPVALCSFEGPGRLVSRLFPVALARGKHLFPFRTEQLSPSAPMVLGSQGPGRVGRRRFLVHEPPPGAARRAVGFRRVSLVADVFARVTPYLAHRPGSARATQAHAWLLRRTGGRLGGRALGADVLVLRTTGRHTGQHRDTPLFFLRHGDGFAVVASNAASTRPPAWWLNLQADPDADAQAQGRTCPVRARAATREEVAELWPRFVRLYGGYEHYRSIATRELPVVILEPR
jgi:deazaflavin-dependent oxidoreductase (nitroreductase family)